MDQQNLKIVVLAVVLLYMGCVHATVSSTNQGKTKQHVLTAADDSQYSSRASSESNKITKGYSESNFDNNDKYVLWNFISWLGLGKINDQEIADIRRVIHDMETDLNISGEHIWDKISEVEQMLKSGLDSRAEHDPVMRTLSMYAEKAKTNFKPLPHRPILMFLIYITILNEAKQNHKELTQDWYFHFLDNEDNDFIQLIAQYHIADIDTKSINMHVYLGFNDDLKFLVDTIMKSSQKTKDKEEEIKWVYILSIIDSTLQSKEVQNCINKLVKNIQRSNPTPNFSADDILQYMLSNGVRINGGTKLYVIRGIDVAEDVAPHSKNHYLAEKIANATEKSIREVFGNSRFTKDMEYFLSFILNNVKNMQNNNTEAKWMALLKYLFNIFSSSINPNLQQGIQKLITPIKENNTITNPLEYMKYIETYIQHLNNTFLSETLKNYSKELVAKIEQNLKNAKVSKAFSDNINYLITLTMNHQNIRNVHLQESWLDILKSIYAITASDNFTANLQSNVHTLINNLKKMNGSPQSSLNYLKENIESLQAYFQKENQEKIAEELSKKIKTILMAALTPEQFLDDIKHIIKVVMEQMNNTSNADLKERWVGILRSVYILTTSKNLTVVIQNSIHDIANNLQEMNSVSSILSYLEQEITNLLRNKHKDKFINFAKELSVKAKQFLENIQVPKQIV